MRVLQFLLLYTTWPLPDTLGVTILTGYNLAMASASLTVKRVTDPVSRATPRSLGEPGLTESRFDPRDASRCSRDALAPSPKASMAMTAATPIKIPRIERNARTLIDNNDSMAALLWCHS